jgi:hypothetical protein
LRYDIEVARPPVKFSNLDKESASRLVAVRASDADHVDHPSGSDPLLIGRCTAQFARDLVGRHVQPLVPADQVAGRFGQSATSPCRLAAIAHPAKVKWQATGGWFESTIGVGERHYAAQRPQREPGQQLVH